MIMRLCALMFLAALALPLETAAQTTRQETNAALFEQLRKVHDLSAAEMQKLQAIFAGSSVMGQGNPAITRHPMTPAQCAARLPGGVAGYDNRRNARICGDRYMAPLYDPRTQRPEDATACIDMFEFPNIPCTYPVVWTKAVEAAQTCAAIGKRLCDAHEWEGACAGALEPPDYPFGRGSVAAMRSVHNTKYAPSKSWAYGPQFRTGICAQNSEKSSTCNGGGYRSCGSNTYPTGAFPDCKSTLGVYDQHGNAAEHMNLPMAPDQMASRGSTKLGVTEMKGSWFIWDKYRAHPDWCRWRAPYWHGSRVMSPSSHENYHLGFRCCKTLD
ncbi:SUMF1/EgtB/PvdO family nonheme iron enzyme [Aestuariicoccus sp. MJ-SS9]|uniref:SUMF1/EgtB/PvdO family nonheme iron enzyme n=1 Tax=Aestuariicoccus sp. MJ-SS9 TaxID=3079855 RepID=UPI00290DF190|nr:SUMF1/EgtB/PvdO family nonheme iron enzyme [Aestuariicoccus sp. MJ-SS9]MDU8912338.1 hypothetical protein [Aestuariicoccus sp. MJ-SS9]